MLYSDLGLVQRSMLDLFKELHLVVFLLQLQVLVQSLSYYLVVVHERGWKLLQHIVLKLFQGAPLPGDQCINHAVKLPEKDVFGAYEF
tara:strand:- start:172 stop:435 length:264 start_codon:yes stop_codon:yes gene_type:complete